MPRFPSSTDLLDRIVPRFGTISLGGIAYGEGPRHRLDIHRPAGPVVRKLPVVVFFYGGSWQSGARGEYAFVGRALARLGLVVAIPDYRLYPEVRYPDFIDDAARATAFVRRNAGQFGGDRRAVFVAGHSAGAYLAMMLALKGDYLAAAGEDEAALAGAIGLAGPYDFLPMTGPVYRRIFDRFADDPVCQPISHASAAAPPSLLITGARDRLVAPANTAALAARLRQEGAVVDTRVYERVSHVNLLLAVLPSFGLLPPVWREIAAFIGRTAPQPGDARDDGGRTADMAGRQHPG
ncbi:alpha/beta hydrolase [Acidiphilium sp. C61]|jgi:acetyl esterase/lipase|uniref:alpha/beta hydrolase n=1 Tax=Acidiphilium sp. C61 TaxID=1671485 RepID=UPI001F404CB2|nr:alpha/beta hydrolase [Acidiphilium sp. C61]